MVSVNRPCDVFIRVYGGSVIILLLYEYRYVMYG